MSTKLRIPRALVVVLAGLALLAPEAVSRDDSRQETPSENATAPQAADEAATPPVARRIVNPYQDLRRHARSLVTVRFVVRVQMPGVDRQVESEIDCLLIGDDGLVLCSNTELGGYFSVLARMMGRSDQAISSSPQDLRVVLEGGNEALAADLVARDSDRDLAWLLIRHLPDDAELHPLDFGHSAEPEIGRTFYQLRLMDPFFGSEPVVSEGVVAAITERPRRLIVPGHPTAGYLGTPVFTADGRLLGIVVAQVPGNDESRAVMSLGQRSLPGQSGKEDDMVGGVILPAADVARATELAREVWAQDQREALE